MTREGHGCDKEHSREALVGRYGMHGPCGQGQTGMKTLPQKPPQRKDQDLGLERGDARNGDVSLKRQKLLLYPKPPNLTKVTLRTGRRRES